MLRETGGRGMTPVQMCTTNVAACLTPKRGFTMKIDAGSHSQWQQKKRHCIVMPTITTIYTDGMII